MDEETPVKTPGFFLPIAIGLLGVVLGGVAIYLTVSDSGAIKSDLTQKLEETAAKIDKYEQRLAELEERGRLASENANTLGMKARHLEEGINRLVMQTQAAVNSLSQEIAALKARPAAPAADVAAAAPATVEKTAEKTEVKEPAAQASGGVYIVQSGDTFTKIARTLGVSISAIEKANPNVDSSRLKIGQKLNVPAKAQ